MAFRRLFKVFLKRASPVLATTTSVFVSCSEINEPNSREKIQWELPDFSKFTYEHMIKQSTVDTVNSVSQALTITYTAIENTSEEYRRSLSLLMSLIRETLAYRVGDSHWDMIVAARSEVQRRKQMVTQLVGYMDYVQKMAVAATEASYMAGMDNLSTTLCQRMDDALNNMNKEIKHNGILEMEYNIIQEECVKKSKYRREKYRETDGDFKDRVKNEFEKHSNVDKLSKKDDEDVKVETILPD